VSDKKLKYSIGTNFDPELISYIDSKNKDNLFMSVFGKLQSDLAGGGRASSILPKLNLPQLKEHVELCHSKNIKFNYLINPMCLNNREMHPKTHRQILKFIENLGDIGVDSLTINSPYLCQLIKTQFPNFKITIGLYAYIYSLQHVRYWEELGADELTLFHTINRNIPMLRKMLEFTKGRSLQLRLIANNICLHDCPYQLEHGTGQSHASQKNRFSTNVYIDKCLFRCTKEKLTNPAKFIASEWIRPEDQHFYENLCSETGNFNLSLKLLERTKTTQFLKNVIDAYVTRNYDGNLLNIMAFASLKDIKSFSKKTSIIKAVLGGYNLGVLKNFIDNFNTIPDICIENKKLDGFFDQFYKNYNCNQNICDDMGLTDENKNNGGCSYCKSWAEKSITYNKYQVEHWINNAENNWNELQNSKLYN
jgi:collagenase-like PrtC family protease